MKHRPPQSPAPLAEPSPHAPSIGRSIAFMALRLESLGARIYIGRIPQEVLDRYMVRADEPQLHAECTDHAGRFVDAVFDGTLR